MADLGAAMESGATGVGAGTPDYLAPETVDGAAPRPAADIYGLGALLFYLLTSRAPWSHLSPEDSLEARRRGVPPIPERADLPAGLRSTQTSGRFSM